MSSYGGPLPNQSCYRSLEDLRRVGWKAYLVLVWLSPTRSASSELSSVLGIRWVLTYLCRLEACLIGRVAHGRSSDVAGLGLQQRYVHRRGAGRWEVSGGWWVGSGGAGLGKWEVLKQNAFDHHTMTMSVVIQNMESGEAYVFCKGSHEAVLSR